MLLAKVVETVLRCFWNGVVRVLNQVEMLRNNHLNLNQCIADNEAIKNNVIIINMVKINWDQSGVTNKQRMENV